MKIRRMNKKGLEFKLAFFALVALSVLIIAIGNWVNEWNDTYNSGLTYDLEGFNKLDNVSSTAESHKSGITVTSPNVGEDFESTSLRGVFGILNNIYQPFRIVFGDNGMIDSVTERFGLPDYIRQAIVTLMIVSITFSLVAILFKLTRRSA